MSQEPSNSTADSNGTDRDWSRRTVLKLTGGGVTLAGLAGVAGGFQEDDGDDEGDGNGGDGADGENGEDEETTDDSAFVEDLIDPTWGYPLAADETGSVDIENVVALETMPGEGAHESFPVDPMAGEPMDVEFKFDPVGLHVEPGAVVHFFSAAGEHTATAFHEKYSRPELELTTRVPEGVPGFTSPPVVDGESWLYQFPEEGIYDLLCLPHLPVGMVMRIVVMETDEDAMEDGTGEDGTEAGADEGTEDGTEAGADEGAEGDSETGTADGTQSESDDGAGDGTEDDGEDGMADDVFTPAPTEELLPNVRRVFEAPELAPENIVEEGSVAWADLTLSGE